MENPEGLHHKIAELIKNHFKDRGHSHGLVEIHEAITAIELTKTVLLGIYFESIAERAPAKAEQATNTQQAAAQKPGVTENGGAGPSGEPGKP